MTEQEYHFDRTDKNWAHVPQGTWKRLSNRGRALVKRLRRKRAGFKLRFFGVEDAERSGRVDVLQLSKNETQ